MPVSFDTIRQLIKDIPNAEVRVELLEQVADAREMVLDLQEQVASLRDENKKLSSREQLRERLNLKHNAYWLDHDNQPKPYCIGCFEKHANAVPLVEVAPRGDAKCPACEFVYQSVFEGPESEHSGYCVDSFFGVRWRWQWDREGIPIKIRPFCPKAECDIELTVCVDEHWQDTVVALRCGRCDHEYDASFAGRREMDEAVTHEIQRKTRNQQSKQSSTSGSPVTDGPIVPYK